MRVKTFQSKTSYQKCVVYYYMTPSGYTVNAFAFEWSKGRPTDICGDKEFMLEENKSCASAFVDNRRWDPSLSN